MIRLTDIEEFLQAYIDSRWIYVCLSIHDYPYNNDKDFKDAIDFSLSNVMDIACRELGYSKANSFQLDFDYRSHANHGPILELGRCTQYDTRISRCEDTRTSSNCQSRISLRCEIGLFSNF